MTAHKKAIQHSVPPEQLAGALLDMLQAGPRTVDDMAHVTRYSGNMIRGRLAELRTLGHVYRNSQSLPDGSRRFIRCASVPGTRPELLPVVKLASPRQIGKPHQLTVKTYPAVDRRDPLVASLFGQAGGAAS